MKLDGANDSRIHLYPRDIEVVLIVVSLGVQCGSCKIQDPIASTGLNIGGHGRPLLGPVGASEDGNRDGLLGRRHSCFCNANESVLQTAIAFPC